MEIYSVVAFPDNIGFGLICLHFLNFDIKHTLNSVQKYINSINLV